MLSRVICKLVEIDEVVLISLALAEIHYQNGFYFTVSVFYHLGIYPLTKYKQLIVYWKLTMVTFQKISYSNEIYLTMNNSPTYGTIIYQIVAKLNTLSALTLGPIYISLPIFIVIYLHS